MMFKPYPLGSGRIDDAALAEDMEALALRHERRKGALDKLAGEKK